LVIALLAGLALSGCGGGGEQTLAVAVAKSGVLGPLGEQLKKDDDEQELRELRDAEALTPAERREQREAAEQHSASAGTEMPLAEEGEAAGGAEGEGSEGVETTAGSGAEEEAG
jgi:hypothetical protein